MLAFDPYVSDLPADVEAVASLAELCERSEALVVHAGLSDETSAMVRAEHFALLPDGGIVVKGFSFFLTQGLPLGCNFACKVSEANLSMAARHRSEMLDDLGVSFSECNKRDKVWNVHGNVPVAGLSFGTHR